MKFGVWEIGSLNVKVNIWSSGNELLVEYNNKNIAKLSSKDNDDIEIDSCKCKISIDHASKKIDITPSK